MNEGNKKIHIFEIAMLLFILLGVFLIPSVDIKIRNAVIISFLGIMLLIAWFLIGYKKDNAFDKELAIKLEISTFIGVFFLYFLLGLFLGFGNLPFSLEKLVVLKGIISATTITVLEEFLRYILYKSNSINKKHIKILTILFIIMSILIDTNTSLFSNNFYKFVYLTLIVFPIIAEELLCSYLTYNFGLLSSLIFKLVIRLYIYVLPMYPNLGDYLYGVFNILIPYIIYKVQRKYIVKVDRLSRRKGKENSFIVSFITAPLVLFLIVLTILVSGVFNHQLIAIASGSMVPTYYRGDAVLVNKEKKEKDNLQVGDILIYKKSNSIIAHRIVKIIESDNNYYYYTKGDANLTEDDYYVEKGEIIGKVECVVKYIGWPTIYINDLFRKR